MQYIWDEVKLSIGMPRKVNDHPLNLLRVERLIFIKQVDFSNCNGLPTNNGKEAGPSE